MFGIGHIFFLSVFLFITLSILLTIENNLGKRVLFSKLRGVFDSVVVAVTNFFLHWFNYFSRHIVKLSWYYSVHKFLRVILTTLIKVYDKLERLFLRNRDRAKVIKTEKKKIKKEGHLHMMADHKASVALTEAQKKKLLAKKLERG
ncbi:MAG: hypothetical protein R3B60_03150 [Candidatus Paceibacterota bacterium]